MTLLSKIIRFRFLLWMCRAEFIFHPSQIISSILTRLHLRSAVRKGSGTVKLPWGLPFKVHANDIIGNNILNYGLFDLTVCELISRLLDSGEMAIDAGSNTGQMAGLMSLCTGPNGKVFAFEPHPEIFGELQTNIASWSPFTQLSPIQPMQIALGNSSGTIKLHVHADFSKNRGSSSIASDADSIDSLISYTVKVSSLDELIGENNKIGLMKIDVEGYEFTVFQGSRRVLASRQIRDILFEDLDEYPTKVTNMLEEYGYKIYRLDGNWRGLRLMPISSEQPHGSMNKHNFLASIDPERVTHRMARTGWNIYSRHAR
jgi:FkbM family methyltransferase